MMKLEVISVGGSIIVPGDIDVEYLKRLRRVLLSIPDKKFILVAGGGKTARMYIAALSKIKSSEYLQSITAMSAINLNAQLLASSFGIKQMLPMSFKEIENYIKKQKITCVGSFEYEKNSTSDTHAAYIAHHFKTRFINITNVNGLYTKDPGHFKNAKLIKKISRANFNKLARNIRFHLGQHFVLDQHAAKFINENKIPTFIIGRSTENLRRLLTGKKFVGTEIV